MGKNRRQWHAGSTYSGEAQTEMKARSASAVRLQSD